MDFYLNIKIFNQKLLNYVKIKREKKDETNYFLDYFVFCSQ